MTQLRRRLGAGQSCLLSWQEGGEASWQAAVSPSRDSYSVASAREDARIGACPFGINRGCGDG
jgi:hypothetical protein